jgi:D-lyxose ketol-isomerase
VAGERAGQPPGARRTLTRTVFFSFSARGPVALTGPVTLIADDLTAPST